VRTLLLVVALFVPLPAAAQDSGREIVDTWSEPNPGVRYLRRTRGTPALSIHAIIVDTRREGVHVGTTPQAERWSTVSEIARTQGAAVAVNGGFWGVWQRPTGVTAGGGELWDNMEPDPEFGHFGVRRDGRAVIYGPGEGEDERSLGRLTDAVSGRPILVEAGAVAEEGLATFVTANQRQPRTAIGISRDGRTVMLVVADGRQSHSRGLTLHQLAALMVELGADRAINLDGGGSSAMYVDRAGGLVTSPSESRIYGALGIEVEETRMVRTRNGSRMVRVRGPEREVMNHVMVIAPAPVAAVPIEAHDDVLAGVLPDVPSAEPIAFVENERPRMRMGSIREVLYPSLYVGVPACALIPPIWLWRRKRRRMVRDA
jgi:hypothetical protein